MEAMDHLKRLLERYPALVELKIGISPLKFHHIPRGVIGCY